VEYGRAPFSFTRAAPSALNLSRKIFWNVRDEIEQSLKAVITLIGTFAKNFSREILSLLSHFPKTQGGGAVNIP